MFTLAVSVPSNKGTLILQDNFPTEGPFILTVLPNTTGTVVISDNQFGRIQADLAALVLAGACTYTITMTPSDPLFAALSTAITPGGSLTSPLQYKGSIAVNTSFPLIAVVASGWMYHITADVTDNAGATYTNTGVAFLAGDEVVWDGSAWIKTGNALTNPFQFKGNLTAANTFPPPAATATTGVKDGWVYRVTTACTDNGGASYTNTGQAFLVGDIIVWRTNAWYPLQSAPSTATPGTVAATAAAGTSGRPANDDHVHAQMANILVDKGSITINSDFPAPTGNLRGDCYRITADVIDNGGATKTNTGLVFTAGDHIMWSGSTWIILNKTYTMVEQGAITSPTTFPLIAFVKRGYVYRVTNATNDTGGATYTNTGLSFKEGDVIVWNGASWTVLGNKVDFQVAGATPVILAANDSVNIVDTATIGAAIAAALPAATALIVGRKITIGDGSGDCVAHNITITPNTTDQIDGVNAPVVINKDYYLLTLTCVAAGKWVTSGRSSKISTATPAAVGSATAGTSLTCSPDDHVHAHGNLAGGSFHAAAVAGVSDGFMTGAMATALAAVTDNSVYAKASGLDIITDEHEHTGVLTGDGAKHFVPTHTIIQVATVTGTPATPGAINVGTTAGGIDIASGIVLTGLVLVGDTMIVPIIAPLMLHLAANGTIYVNVETAEAVATVMTCDVWVIGRQF
jgi:hypothetical protein